MPGERRLLTVKESAALLCLSEHTIRQWIWQRRLPVVRLGRAVRLCREDLEQLIEHNREEAIVLMTRALKQRRSSCWGQTVQATVCRQAHDPGTKQSYGASSHEW